MDTPRLRRGGASTLATQIEKYRHSPDGRTENATEKMRQIVTATARAYLDGFETIAAQREIVTAYLDSTPWARGRHMARSSVWAMRCPRGSVSIWPRQTNFSRFRLSPAQRRSA